MQDARAAGIDPLWGCIFRNGNVSRELCSERLVDDIHHREIGRVRACELSPRLPAGCWDKDTGCNMSRHRERQGCDACCRRGFSGCPLKHRPRGIRKASVYDGACILTVDVTCERNRYTPGYDDGFLQLRESREVWGCESRWFPGGCCEGRSCGCGEQTVEDVPLAVLAEQVNFGQERDFLRCKLGWKERRTQHPLRDEDKRIPPRCLGSSECDDYRIPACRCVDSCANLFEQAVNLAIFTTGGG